MTKRVCNAGRSSWTGALLASTLVVAIVSPVAAELGAPVQRLTTSPLLREFLGLTPGTPCLDPAPPAGVRGYTLACFRSTKWAGVSVVAYADQHRRVAAQSLRITMARFGGTGQDMVSGFAAFATEATAKQVDHPRLGDTLARALRIKQPITYFDGRYLIEVKPSETNPQPGCVVLDYLLGQSPQPMMPLLFPSGCEPRRAWGSDACPVRRPAECPWKARVCGPTE